MWEGEEGAVDIVMDLINVLLGSSSVNMVLHATREKDAFSMSTVMSHRSG
jgi:hypothetical protein